MAYPYFKPLPDIPDIAHIYGLCVESDTLLTTLLHQAIIEEGLEQHWFESVKRALCDLGRYIESQNVLAGISSLRKLENQPKRSFVSFDSRSSHAQPHRTNSKGKASTDTLKVIELESIESRTTSFSADIKLNEIRQRISSQTSVTALSPMHLLIAVSPLTPTIGQNCHDLVRGGDSNLPGILFQKDVFHFSSESHNDRDGGIVIYGLDNWRSDLHAVYIMGGTFTFNDIPSDRPFESLLSVLRISLYAYFSLLLEQSVLHNFHVPLQYPSPAPPPPPSSPPPPPPPPSTVPASIPEELPPAVEKRKSVISKPGFRIWSFISRKSENIFHRASGSAEDGEATLSPTAPSETAASNQNPVSESHQESKVDSTSFSVNVVQGLEREQSGPFTASVQRLLDPMCILSTSLRVRFPPPPLLVQLAAREEEQRSLGIIPGTNSSISSISTSAATIHHNFKITGIERTGLSSIIGWEHRDSRGKGMCGIKGFIRQQGLTILYRKSVRIGSLERPCGKPSCMSYRYYSRNSDDHTTPDPCVGEVIETLCDVGLSLQQCPVQDCKELLWNHVHSWTCDDVTIKAHLDKSLEHHSDTEDGEITMWQSCSICKEETSRTKMDVGTYLFSFAKFLEILVWSPTLRSSPLCSHKISGIAFQNSDTIDPKNPPYNLNYHFLHNNYILTLSIRPISHGAYEIRFPRLQIQTTHNSGGERSSKMKRDGGKHVLEAEIEEWWQAIDMHIDKLDDFLESLTEMNKDLPPLPGSDDEDEEEEVSKGISLLSPRSTSTASPASSNTLPSFSPGYTIWSNLKNFGRTVPYPPSVPCRAIESRVLLAELRRSFEELKESLRNQLIDTPVSSLNDTRRKFRFSAKGSLERLSAWQKKHVPGAPKYLADKNPKWWNDNCHAVPGGCVLVREDESGSIIAFTLSSLDYQRELTSLSSPSRHARSRLNSSIFQSHDSIPLRSSTETFKSSAISADPDLDDNALWSQAETCAVAITRCEHPREESILGLRDVLRAASVSDPSSFNSRFTQESTLKGPSLLLTPSIWAQPQVQVSLNAADGELTQSLDDRSAETSFESDSRLSHGRVSVSASTLRDYDRFPTPLSYQEYNNGGTQKSSSDMKPEGMGHEISLAAPRLVSTLSSLQIPGASTPTQNGTLTETLTSAMRYLFTSGFQPPSRAPSPAPSSTLHSLLAYDSLYSIDEQPHIRYDCTIGQRLKFSCTVYYAKQFDLIRKRCGVDTDIIESLQRSENWSMDGGKSKSNFWKSLDGRFIIKTLVNAWNVADLQVLIELAPSYFRYIESTSTKASALAKLMGFYTVEVKNLETGVIQTKHDMLVMENLFYERTISRIYDLKGISSRKAKIKAEQSRAKTLYDVEWIAAQEQDPLLLRGYSAHILQEALRTDTEFLAKSNIMDYSLLVGMDEEKHHISCGLVDTIGSYTFAKTLEYKAKHNLIANRGKDVTVIPPTEYQHRFVTALEGYFLACPDKWTKPRHYVDRTKSHELPDVF